MRDDAFSEESDTCQRKHERTQRSADKRSRWNLTEHRRLPMTAEKIDPAHALIRVSKKFLKVFSFRKFWFLLKIAAVQYRQRQSVGNVRFSWFTLHGPWLFLCVRLASSRFCFVMCYFPPGELKICLWCASWCDALKGALHQLTHQAYFQLSGEKITHNETKTRASEMHVREQSRSMQSEPWEAHLSDTLPLPIVLDGIYFLQK